MWWVKTVVSCHRVFILNETITDWLTPIKFGMRELRFVGVLIVVSILCFLIMIPFALIFVPIVTSAVDPAENNVLLAALALNIAYLPVFYVSSRWALLFPAAATDDVNDVGWAWKFTEGNGFQLFLLVGILPFVVGILMSLLPNSDLVIVQAVYLAISALIMVVEIGILSTCYQQLLKK